jgi:hypothetical protein
VKRILALGIASVIAGCTAWLLACGPRAVDLVPVRSGGPADERAYAKGDLGVVRPDFSFRYLLQAYRTLAPRSPGPAAVTTPAVTDPGSSSFWPDPVAAWAKNRTELLGTAVATSDRAVDSQNRRVPGSDYQTFLNCPDDAFAGALWTLKARSERFGLDSAQVRDWTRAQAAVFENCHDGPLVLPAPAAVGADELIRADRAYQTAAAYFYATQYEEAVRRFRTIADDRGSAWRPTGRYLAARANIRFATVPTASPDQDRLAAAETDLRAVLADTAAAPLHRSARGLLGFVAARIHPIERLHELSTRLTAAGAPADQDFYDYRFILDAVSSQASPFPRTEVVRGDDLTDWLTVMRQRDEAATARALERWHADKAPVWLVAALWRVDGTDPDADALLEAARLIDRRSPAFPTVAFLRVRLLASLGRARDARAALASLPARPAPGFGAETINLFKAERLMLAENLDQFLANAPRAIVVEWSDPYRFPNGRLRVESKSHDQPVFDEDAATILAEQLPLARLVDAALSPALPPRLRQRVAVAAFTRAIVLRRGEAGARLVPVLRETAPMLRADLDRYARAGSADERYSAGVLFLLNTPGATVDVRGDEDDFWFEVVEPAREFDHTFRRNWWCDVNGRFHNKPYDGASEAVRLLYADGRVSAPAFVTAAERAAAERERLAILAEGRPGTWLARAALRIAHARRKDPAVAEVLARVVDGWRWTCRGDDDSETPLPQQAFTLLHRLFPNSEAAHRTAYWYRD